MRGRRRHGTPSGEQVAGIARRRPWQTWREGGPYGPIARHAATAPVHECLTALALMPPEVALGRWRLSGWNSGAPQQIALKDVAQRWRGGHVRERHGDLHLANIAWITANRSCFDALEFKPDLRWIDCMADLAFGDGPASAWAV